MRKKYWMRFTKITAFVICFVILFAGTQKMFKHAISSGSNSTSIELFNSLEGNVNILFLGSSQMFCTVNAQKLTEEYNISSCDWGASAQPLPITYYYLQEASKYIHPKLVAVEITKFFQEGIPDNKVEQVCTWNYYNMPLTVEKYHSISGVFDGDPKKLLTCGLIPLLESHSVWHSANWPKQIKGLIQKTDYSSRGFLCRNGATHSNIAYLGNDDGPMSRGAEDEISAIYDIINFCREDGADVLFFKAPSDMWTRNESKVVKEFMKENDLNYLEMNDYINEIGINAATDFYNEGHLNIDGANKATDFLAKYLLENYGELLK